MTHLSFAEGEGFVPEESVPETPGGLRPSRFTGCLTN